MQLLGWNDHYDALLDTMDRGVGGGLRPARVVAERRGEYTVFDGSDRRRARISGKLRHAARSRLDFPAVGDWVLVDRKGVIEGVLERKTAFVRRTPGRRGGVQVVAANVDTVFVVTSLNMELNVRRLERYCTATWEAGATPVIVLNKADLHEDPDAVAAELSTTLLGVECVVTCAKQDRIEPLDRWLLPGRTCAFVGSSGVGKSTLVNALLGEERQTTRDVREGDDKGRHTTTTRELFVLGDDRGVLIDTPGMRELQLYGETGLQDSFADLDALAANCRFRDCTHDAEPGCAVRDGISPERLAAWHKLMAEAEAERRRNNPAEQRRYERVLTRMYNEVQADARVLKGETE